ncbi:hydrolase 76 protein [Vermiconidia calcicola]|uniref:Hydrolase 76 protein n=1 Tax=Vermiconidia calcicola TaxID=1690605 RepID=A0ACC3NEB7_9PEZI|nr:hydrolase 76 protein [Vermiconidia calcicola]
MFFSIAAVFSSLLLLAHRSIAIEVDITDVQSISDAAKTIASHVVSYYGGDKPGTIPGLLPDPYYWWESGLAYDSLIEYWAKTGDDTYNEQITEGMLFQMGSENNFMPSNQTANIGNDDQSTWALASMTAAENGFPEPPSDSGIDSWLQLAQNVFDNQVARWQREIEDKTCGGGLRWQIFPFNVGYEYKNAPSNGNFLQLAARLARYTGNQTYSNWARTVSDWSFDIGLIEKDTFGVLDGAFADQDCKKPLRIQWSANLGRYLEGYAYLANSSTIREYQDYPASMLEYALGIFLPQGNIVTETACQARDNCNVDQLAYRSILARALATTRAMDVSTSDAITPVLQASALGAAAQCSGGKDGTTCGSDWASTKWDKSQGLGQDLSALEILLANIPEKQVRTVNGTSTSGRPGTPTGSSPGASGSFYSTPLPPATGGAGDQTAPMFGLFTALGLAVVLS